MPRPQIGEYGEFYTRYISLATGESPAELISIHSIAINDQILQLPEEKGNYSYEKDKWTIKQVLQHMLDTERIFTYRLLWIARGDERPLQGFDENAFAKAAPASHRKLSDLQQEFVLLRRSSDYLITGLTEHELSIKGEASGYPVTVNALCFMIFGHNLHHLNVIKERYLDL